MNIRARLRRIFSAAILIGIPLLPVHAEAASRHVLVFGDSISWGWVPNEKGFPAARYAEEDRWPTFMAKSLGDDYAVSVNAISGRTTDVDYSEGIGTLTGADFNGLKALPGAVASETPLDLVIVFLGTNDLRADVGRTPDQIAAGAIRVARLAQEATGVLTPYAAPKVLVVAPPPLGDISRTPISKFMAGGPEKSHGLAAAYGAAADKAGIALFDAGTATTTDGVDGVHFTVDDNRRLGTALATRVRALLEPKSMQIQGE